MNNNIYDTSFGYSNAATGVFNTFTQASKFAIPEWRYHNVEFYAQDNWKAGNKLTLDYGVRFYWLTPQWDESLQASNFIPSEFDRNSAAKLYVPVCIGAAPCSGSARVGMDPRLVAQGVTPTADNTVNARFIGRLTPDSNRFNGSFQAGQGIFHGPNGVARIHVGAYEFFPGLLDELHDFPRLHIATVIFHGDFYACVLRL